jgi:tetratricopeptide (TPR) repeat protein
MPVDPVDRARAGAELTQANAGLADGQLAEALAAYDRFLALDPGFAPAHNNRALTLLRLGRPGEAVSSLEAALALAPDYAPALANLALACRDLGRPAEALAACNRALVLQPDLPEAHSDRGNALYDLGRMDEALGSYDRAIALRPSFADAHRNRGAALYRLARPREAVAAYDTALSLEPESAVAHHGRALALLLQGDHAAGWPAYEWRKRLPGWDSGTGPPDWTGQGDIAGRRLLVRAEQGLGDTLQFVRLVPALGARGAAVVLQVQRGLETLLAANLPGASVIGPEDDPGVVDAVCALMSLPLGLALGEAAMPAPYLFADPARVDHWRAALPPDGRRRIGLAWSGAARHPDDANRSIALQRLAPLLAVDAQWICLQQEIRPADAAQGALIDRIEAEPLADMADTAALMETVDLVMSVDTSLAHLAIALGKPVWILLPFAPDWRWGLDRDEVPWAPAARLFRQPAAGDWESVIAVLVAALGV